MFRGILLWAAVGAAAIAAVAHAWAAERPTVDVLCSPTDKKLIYLCIFKVAAENGGQPVEDAEFTVTADAPGLPQASSGAPVEPVPTERPGIYRGSLEIAKLGEWDLKLEFSKPVEATLVKKVTFGPLGGTAD